MPLVLARIENLAQLEAIARITGEVSKTLGEREMLAKEIKDKVKLYAQMDPPHPLLEEAISKQMAVNDIIGLEIPAEEKRQRALASILTRVVAPKVPTKEGQRDSAAQQLTTSIAALKNLALEDMKKEREAKNQSALHSYYNYKSTPVEVPASKLNAPTQGTFALIEMAKDGTYSVAKVYHEGKTAQVGGGDGLLMQVRSGLTNISQTTRVREKELPPIMSKSAVLAEEKPQFQPKFTLYKITDSKAIEEIKKEKDPVVKFARMQTAIAMEAKGQPKGKTLPSNFVPETEMQALSKKGTYILLENTRDDQIAHMWQDGKMMDISLIRSDLLSTKGKSISPDKRPSVDSAIVVNETSLQSRSSSDAQSSRSEKRESVESALSMSPRDGISSRSDSGVSDLGISRKTSTASGTLAGDRVVYQLTEEQYLDFTKSDNFEQASALLQPLTPEAKMSIKDKNYYVVVERSDSNPAIYMFNGKVPSYVIDKDGNREIFDDIGEVAAVDQARANKLNEAIEYKHDEAAAKHLAELESQKKVFYKIDDRSDILLAQTINDIAGSLKESTPVVRDGEVGLYAVLSKDAKGEVASVDFYKDGKPVRNVLADMEGKKAPERPAKPLAIKERVSGVTLHRERTTSFDA